MSFNLNGVDYASKTAAAIDLVNNQKKTVKEAAVTVGIAYQTVYVNTVGKESRMKQMAKLQAKRLISSNREYSKAEISRRTGLGDKTVRKIFDVVTGNAPAEMPETEKLATSAVEKPIKKATAKKVKSTSKKSTKKSMIAPVVPADVTPTIVPVAEVAPVIETPVAEVAPVIETPVAEVAPVIETPVVA